MPPARRIERVNSIMRQELSDLLQRNVKDPRLEKFVTITAVETTADLRFARVYVSQMGSDAEKEGTLRGLAQAAGFLRGELGKRLRLRRIPELNFQLDESIERGDRILHLIDEVSEAPKQPENK